LPDSLRSLPLVAEFAAGLTYQDLPHEAAAAVKIQCLEVVGGLISGSRHPYANAIRRYVGEVNQPQSWGPGSGQVNFFPFGQAMPVPLAIVANVGLSHCTELDPVHATSLVCAPALIHPLLWSVLPAGISGRQYLASAAAGTEVAVRLGLCLNGPEMFMRGWWPSSICGAFGAVSALASVMELSAAQTGQALAIAALQVGGLITGGAEGPLARHYVYGRAAADGYHSILLMKSGFTGPGNALGGPRGMASALAEHPDYGYFEDIGKSFLLVETGLKLYGSSRQGQSSIHAFLSLMRRHDLSAEDIGNVEIRVPSQIARLLDRSSYPDNGSGAIGHGRYLIAVAALDGEVLPQQFTDQRRADPRLAEFMKKVSIIEDAGMDGEYPRNWPARVTIGTASGTYQCEVENPPGDPRNPLSDEDRIDKFHRVADPVIGAKRAAMLVSAVSRIEAMDDISELTRLLMAPDICANA
jgi:2-methylcitrate dehydratase PrpD